MSLQAPVFGAGGGIELTLGMVMPARTASERETAKLGELLRGTADRASRELGFTG